MKMNRVQWILIMGLASILISAVLLYRLSVTSPSEVAIGNTNWNVEWARTETEQARGLGYREKLCRFCGMLFVFPQPGQYQFWMKEMRFPIDIVFIADGKVLSVERHIDPRDLRVFAPPEPVSFVLEVNAGEADAVAPGMEVLGLPE